MRSRKPFLLCPSPTEWLEYLDCHTDVDANDLVRIQWNQHLIECDQCRRGIEKSLHDESILPRRLISSSIDETTEHHRLRSMGSANALAAAESLAFIMPASLPGYSIGRMIGKGGMGVVFEGIQRSLKRKVAIKALLHGVWASDNERKMIQREAIAISRLQHPNIVHVIEVVELDGLPYLIMEHIDGPSLADLLTGEPWPTWRAVELIEQLARATDFAHTHGVIHRDLKPANILMQDGVVPRIADFGLAMMHDDRISYGPSDPIVGTPEYSAPEQLAGGPSHRDGGVGGEADIYSLGAILYELITGRRVFAATRPADVIAQVRYEPPIAPKRLEPSIPLDLQTICLKCLQKNPKRRYDSASAFADDLKRFISGEPVLARPVGSTEQIARWLWRKPEWLIALAGSILLALGATLALSLLWRSASLRADSEQSARKEADGRAIAESRARNVLNRRALELEVDQALGLCEKGEVEIGIQALRALQAKTNSEQDLHSLVRNNLYAWHFYSATLLHRNHHNESVRSIQFSTDTQLYCTLSDRRTKLWDTSTGECLMEHPSEHLPITSTLITEDSRFFCARNWEQVVVYDTTNASIRLEEVGKKRRALECFELRSVPEGRLMVNLDGARIAILGEKGEVEVWDLARQEKIATTLIDGKATSADFCAKTSTLAISTDVGGVWIWDSLPGTSAREILSLGKPTKWLQFADKSKCLLVSTDVSEIHVIALGDNPHLLRTITPHMPVQSLIAPKDSSLIFGGLGEGPPRRLGECIVWGVDTRRRLRVLEYPSDISCLATSSTGDRLLTGGGARRAYVWLECPWNPAQIAIGSAGFIESAAMTLDGQVAAISMQAWHSPPSNNQPLTEVWQLPPKQLAAEAIPFPNAFRLEAASNADLLVATDRSGTIRSWNADGTPVGYPIQHDHRIWLLSVSPNGQQVLFYSNGLYAADTGTGAYQRVHHRKGVPKSIVYHPTGNVVAISRNSGSIEIYDAMQLESLAVQLEHEEPVTGLAFTFDGEQLAVVGAGGKLKIWDWANGRITQSAQLDAELSCVAFSPDGRTVAVGAFDRTIHFRNVATGTNEGPAITCQKPVGRIQWSRSNCILVADSEGSVRLYDAVTRRPIGKGLPTDTVNASATWSNDERSIITASADAGIQSWKSPIVVD